jgi:phytoene synthase
MNINKYSLITKKYSNTFYYSTLIFPKEVRDKVFVLYSFVRTIDNLMDCKKPDIAKFNDLRSSFEKAWKGEPVNNKLVVDFVSVAKSNNFSKKWIDDFFDAQILSANKKTYNDFDDLKKNIYGVAGVIGLFMSKIIGLPKKVYKNAVLLGESMQIINCMRDIVEDYKIGRIYIPVEDLEKFGLSVDNFLNKKNRNKFRKRSKIPFRKDKCRSGWNCFNV